MAIRHFPRTKCACSVEEIKDASEYRGQNQTPFVLGVKGANGSGNGCTGIGVSQQIPFVELQKTTATLTQLAKHIYTYI